MRIKDAGSSLGALMPSGVKAEEAITQLYEAILSETSGMTQYIIRHQLERPLLVGDLVVCMDRVGRWEGWKVLHRTPLGTTKTLMRFEAMVQKPEPLS